MTLSRFRFLSVATLAVVMSLGIAADARAQGYISPFLGYDFGGDSGCPEVTDCEDKKLNVGVSLGAMNNVVGFEQEFAYARDFFGDAPGLESSVLTVMSNFMIVPNLGPIRPYALIGAGLIKTHVEFTPASIIDADNNHFGWDAGGGFMGFFGEHVGIRGELRFFRAFQDLELLGLSIDGEKLDFGRASAGLIFKF
jgi:hypothetical protein